MSGVDPRRVEEVFDGAAGLAADEVGQYLDRACAGDAALRGEVMALLAADARAEEVAPERIAERAVLSEAEAPTMPEPRGPAARASEAREPRTIGAFEIVRKLGEGGMGVVYEAHDARLDRRVAVKLVHVGGGAVGQTRLLQEARALAKVAHPNVVAIHEVGVVGDEVFIVMELVEGETLSSWLRRGERSWRDVLAKYAGAGRGLAAAHEAGIVHRDFKPDNVLVGGDGRPRVVDFGLARVAVAATSAADPVLRGPSDGSRGGSGEASRGSSRGDATPLGLTAAGAIMGTPGYMSPEHFRGEAIDPRSDQFSFAVAVYRGLFGRAPFEGRDLGALREAVAAGPASPPAGTEIPPAVVDALLRALSADKDDRFPSMHELLVVLEGAIATSPELDPLRSRNKRRLAGAVLVVIAAATAVPVGEGPPVWSTPRGLLVLGLFALCTLLVLGVVFRRMLAESAYNRRIALIHVMPVVGFVVHRALALRLGASVEAILVADALSIAVLLGFAGIMLERWIGIGAILALGYAVAATLYPAWAAPGFGSLLCVMAAVPVLWWTPRSRRQRHATERGSGAGKASNSGRSSGS